MCVLIHKIVAYKKPGYLGGRVTESRSWWTQSESAQGESKTCPTSDLLECNCSGAYIQCRTSQQRLQAHFKYSFFKQLATMGVILEILSVPVHYLPLVTYNSWRHYTLSVQHKGKQIVLHCTCSAHPLRGHACWKGWGSASTKPGPPAPTQSCREDTVTAYHSHTPNHYWRQSPCN